MPLEISHLSVQIHLGSSDILLKSTDIPSLPSAIAGAAADAVTKAAGDAKLAMQNAVKAGLSFKMEEGQEISLTVADMFSWINANLMDAAANSPLPVPTFISSMLPSGAALNQVIISVYDLEISTKGFFSVSFQIKFTSDFWTQIGVPTAITKMFSVQSVGIGVQYQKVVTTS